jgi:phycobilisome rod-core linker protein
LDKFYSEKAKTQRLSEGDPRKYADMAASVSGKGNYAQSIKASSLDYLNLVPSRGSGKRF